MDRQLLDTLKNIYKGMVVYDLLCIIVLFIAGMGNLKTIGGVVCGTLVSMVTLFMLAKNIEAYVGKEKMKAAFSSVFGFFFRFAAYAAILVFAAVTKHINLYTTALGLISTNLVIKIQQLILKRKQTKIEP